MSIAMTVGLVGALAGAVVALVVLPRRPAAGPTPEPELAATAEAGAGADSSGVAY